VANAGPIMPEGSVKAAQFIQLCCQADMPIIYLQNTTGYMVGKDAEQGGAIKHGAKMIQAVANASVPQITLIVGGAYGAGNYGMCGRAYDPRFIFAWPNSRVAVMGAEQAATVMKLITRAKFERKGMPVDEDALEQMTEHVRRKLDAETRALFATGRVFDAAYAEKIGLVHEVVPADGLDAAKKKLAREIMACAPGAVADSKQLVDDVFGREIDHHLKEMTAKRIAHRRIGYEGREGVAAFLERRKPSWHGG